MRPLTKREKYILVFCLVMIVGLGAYNFIFKPFSEAIENVGKKIESQQKKLRSNQRIIQKAKAVKRDYENYVAGYKQSKSNEQAMSALLSEIEEAANQLQLRIADLKPQKVKENDFYNQFSVSLTIDSDFGSVLQFLYTLQNKPHLLNVEEIQFEKGSQRNSSSVKTNLVLSRILIP